MSRGPDPESHFNFDLLLESDDPDDINIISRKKYGLRPDYKEFDSRKVFTLASKLIANSLASVPDIIGAMDSPPDEFEIKLGVRLSASYGAVLSKNLDNANFVVRAVWKRRPDIK